MFYRRRCWPCWISIKIVSPFFLLVVCLVLPSSINPFDMTWKFVTIETNIPIVSIYMLFEKISTFQWMRTAIFSQKNLHFLFGMEKASFNKVSHLWYCHWYQKLGNLLCSYWVLISVCNFSTWFLRGLSNLHKMSKVKTFQWV